MADGFCECGCGEKTKLAKQTSSRNGWIKGEPLRFLPNHHHRLRRLAPDSFQEQGETDCWVWQWSLTGPGYGQYRGALAHRSIYEELVGPIPSGLTLDHLCRNRACVNPGHVEPVTFTENVLRGESPAAANAQKTHCKRGHPLSGDNLYVAPGKTKRECRICRLAASARSRERGKASHERTREVGSHA